MEKKFALLAVVAVSLTFLVPVDAYAVTAHQKTTAKKHTRHVKNKKSTTAFVATNKTESKPQSVCASCSDLPVISGTFDITSNYMFRGISNSNNSPAVQGGLTATFIKGLYVNVWGSNVNFPDIDGNTATMELDTNAGITNKIGENWDYDVYIGRYNYPNTNGLSYNEVIGSLGYRIFTVLVGYSANVFDTHKNGTYYDLSANYPIPYQGPVWNNIALTGGVGYYDLPGSAGLRSYANYNLGLSKTIGMYNLALQWIDTNHNSIDAENLKDSKIVGTVTVSF